MKFNKITIALLLVFTVSSIQSNAQKTHIIRLNVDTGKITKQTVNTYANFGQTNGVSNINYNTYVGIGDYVKWVGVSSSSRSDIVSIKSINHQGGARVFGKNVLRGHGGEVVGKVTQGKPGQYEKYTVKFHVYINGVRKSGTFIIDPKLTIKTNR